MSSVSLPIRRSFGETMRRGAWWLPSLLTFIGLGAFVVYSTWAAFQGDNYWYDGNGAHYLSPFYSPEIFGNSPHALFGKPPSWIPSWLPFSPALLILWAPGGFRFTCYYYRGAYYKAFWADPISCAVGEPRGDNYRGERKFPLILQNIHRYFLYFALIFLIFLAYDAINAYRFTDGFHVNLGSIILTANVFFLAGYTFSCHSLRHLVGGRNDELSNKPMQCAAYNACSSLNKRHMLFAWCSLFVVGFSDIYVRMLSMGIWSDFRFF
ncbi:succinate dehydrogenase membrane anchor subunit [soil metagenome]